MTPTSVCDQNFSGLLQWYYQRRILEEDPSTQQRHCFLLGGVRGLKLRPLLQAVSCQIAVRRMLHRGRLMELALALVFAYGRVDASGREVTLMVAGEFTSTRHSRGQSRLPVRLTRNSD